MEDCETYNTLGLNNMYAGDAKQTRYRYAEYETQYGGKMTNLENQYCMKNINSFLSQLGAGKKPEYDSDDELDLEDDDENILEGGCEACETTATSEFFMSELQNINQLSATSNNLMQTGGKPKSCEASNVSSLSGFEMSLNGGCPCSSNIISGGKKQISDELNIMPFFSSTSGSEYYTNMQKEHRYA
jgi:hypothetical protein